MKTLIISILLLLSINLFAQNPGRLPYKTVIQYASGDTIKSQLDTDTARITTNQNAFKFNKPIFVNGTELGSGGSTITASDGVYMDGDTVKLKYITDHDSSLIWNFKENNFIPYATDGNFFGGIDLNKNYVELSTTRQHYPNLPFAEVTVVNDEDKIVNITQSTRGYEGNVITLQIDTTGAHYLSGSEPDTTLTTPNHLMTEAQVKREIAAASNLWTPVAGGIGYNGAIWPGQIRKVYVNDINYTQLDSVSANSTAIKSTTNRGIALSISNNYGTNMRNTTNYGNVIYNNDNRGYVIYNNLNSGTTIYESSLGIGAATIRGNYQGSLARISNSREDTIIVVNNTGNAVYRKNAALYALKNLGVLSNVLRGDGKQVIAQIQASLTDGAPTTAQITSAVGESPSDVRAGYQATIKDTDGTGLLYKIESDGTDWFYTVMTKAL